MTAVDADMDVHQALLLAADWISVYHRRSITTAPEQHHKAAESEPRHDEDNRDFVVKIRFIANGFIIQNGRLAIWASDRQRSGTFVHSLRASDLLSYSRSFRLPGFCVPAAKDVLIRIRSSSVAAKLYTTIFQPRVFASIRLRP